MRGAARTGTNGSPRGRGRGGPLTLSILLGVAPLAVSLLGVAPAVQAQVEAGEDAASAPEPPADAGVDEADGVDEAGDDPAEDAEPAGDDAAEGETPSEGAPAEGSPGGAAGAADDPDASAGPAALPADEVDPLPDRDPALLRTTTTSPPPIRYFLERVEVRGNTSTRDYVVRRFVPLERGDVLDVDDPAIETIRWRLLGTGYFDEVRLRLQRGSERGWVILVIEVEERNTLVIQQLALGISQGIQGSDDTSEDILPYAGISIAETNLLGLGMELSVSGLVSKRQQGVRARFTDPVFFGSSYLFSISAFYNDALEFFGDDDVRVEVTCPEPDPGEEEEECPPEVEARNAVVLYERVGMSLGFGHDLGASARYTLDWQGELVNVRVRPDAASESRGTEVEPIDFAIADGVSLVSSIQLGLAFDRRDDPALPSEGWHIRFRGDAASRLIGSDYSFLRLQVLARRWVPLPWAGHHVRFGAFGGAIFGNAPFFYRFYAADLSDLIPSRVLEMNIDNRAPPNVLDTSVAEMRAEEVAGRLDIEYGVPLYRGGEGIRAVNAYFGAGVYALADRKDLQVAIPGYEGLSRIPIDLTFDLGLRADTNIGVFQLGFSSLLGFFAF